MKAFLTSSEYIDCDHPKVVAKAACLAGEAQDQQAVAAACFQFVRDEIKHSFDYRMNPVTCKASDVLLHGTGYCYAKSHLLAALLRANGIPAGLCYQRLTITDKPLFCLHGLNAVYLQPHGWYRIDARGNKPGVNAEFCPPVEKLAFPIAHEGEADLPEIWAEPLPLVVKALESFDDYWQLSEHLPDIELIHRSQPYPESHQEKA